MVKTSRMAQNSTTAPFRPTVRVLSITNNPIGTLFCMWYGSRHKDHLDAEVVERLYREGVYDEESRLTADLICESYPEHNNEEGVRNVIYMIVKQVIEADLPPSESVLFNIEIDAANVAWREQLVRSKFASYWTQTSRTQDLSTMDVNMSDSIELFGGQEAVDIYKNTVDTIRKAYKDLTALGVPMEDIRLQPQGHTHRVYWMINLRSLIKILNKRSDWIAQASLWTPITSGVCAELRRLGLYDILDEFIGKPPVKIEYLSDIDCYHVYDHSQTTENEDRLYGRDPLPCDPLWLAFTKRSMPSHTNIEYYDYLKSMFIQIWSDEYLNVLGWDRDNPKAIGPFDRPRSWFIENNRSDEVAHLR